MGDYLVSILVIIATAIVVGMIFFLVNQKKKQKEALIQQLAQRQGWKYQKIISVHQDGYSLQDDGWTFESVATSSSSPSESGSSSVLYSNCWFSDRFTSSEGLVMIGPKMPSMLLGGMADFFLQQAVKLMLGEDGEEAEGLHEVEVSRRSIQERFSVFAADEEVAAKVLTFNVENALINWKLKELPIIKVLSRGTEIRMKDGRVDKPEEIMALIELGNAFLSS